MAVTDMDRPKWRMRTTPSHVSCAHQLSLPHCSDSQSRSGEDGVRHIVGRLYWIDPWSYFDFEME